MERAASVSDTGLYQANDNCFGSVDPSHSREQLPGNKALDGALCRQQHSQAGGRGARSDLLHGGRLPLIPALHRCQMAAGARPEAGAPRPANPSFQGRKRRPSVSVVVDYAPPSSPVPRVVQCPCSWKDCTFYSP
jgi:hypothetical protein